MNLIFDFDGTICDSLDTYLSVTNLMLKKLKKGEITKREIRRKGAQRVLKEKKVPNFTLPFILIYGRIKVSSIIPSQKPFKEIPETILKLARDHTLGIVTSNSKKNVIKFLQKNDLESYFSFVCSSINYFNKSTRINGALHKHNLKQADTLFIGDETRDVRSAKLSEIKTVAVTWGTENRSLLAKANPDYIIKKPSELLKIIDR